LSIDNANATSTSEPNLFLGPVSYNERGQVASLTDANGSTTSYTYDLLGRVTDINKNSGQLRYQYARDASGMIAAMTLTDPAYGTRTESYTYDAQDRLTGLSHSTDASLNRSFACDAADNMTKNTGPELATLLKAITTNQCANYFRSAEYTSA
jgi:YD repeat-containing protein